MLCFKTSATSELQALSFGFGLVLLKEPKGSKVPHHKIFRVSILGIAMMVLGRYIMVGYLDP